MPAAYTSMLSIQVSDFEDIRLLIQHDRLIYDSCSSGQRFACSFLQPTPHDGNLAVRLTLPPVGCVEDLHLQVSAPCRAHKKKGRAFSGPAFSILLFFYFINVDCPMFLYPMEVGKNGLAAEKIQYLDHHYDLI